MPRSVGILAYGSLIDDPGTEIKQATVDTTWDITTPFNVECARSSDRRGGAPTLVPVQAYGCQVKGCVFVLDVEEQEATHRLYRREVNDTTGEKRYSFPNAKKVGPDRVLVERLIKFAGLDVVLYTKIGDTIGNVSAAELARRAIESVAATDERKDGISYLINATAQGIRTAISAEYQEQIKLETGTRGLEEALRKLRTYD